MARKIREMGRQEKRPGDGWAKDPVQKEEGGGMLRGQPKGLSEGDAPKKMGRGNRRECGRKIALRTVQNAVCRVGGAVPFTTEKPLRTPGCKEAQAATVTLHKPVPCAPTQVVECNDPCAFCGDAGNSCVDRHAPTPTPTPTAGPQLTPTPTPTAGPNQHPQAPNRTPEETHTQDFRDNDRQSNTGPLHEHIPRLHHRQCAVLRGLQQARPVL
jgi:hypothetical protein|mmetsp:Transcript_29596/g.50263  ORF Transcript_29596/g.50263 Transcript_29596/m.50263 type:complete len:213 (-) Transcript_29596:1435-2073(-)